MSDNTSNEVNPAHEAAAAFDLMKEEIVEGELEGEQILPDNGTSDEHAGF